MRPRPPPAILHVYTRRIGGVFYVEVRQRVDGYDSYGPGNTPVRLVAQAAQAADWRPSA
ncbi:MAG: hypothetical protein M3171_07570 [Actinomycetota bacterium]|nr:hypothetical protein [Actinomycetota bacterium]